MEDSGTELQPILRSDDAIRESHPSSVLHAGADDFLRVGCMYTFNPVKALPHLVLHHALQPNSHPAFAIRRTSVLVVLNRTGTWRLITCAGYEGWVNISDDFAKTKAFIKCNSVARYQDWRGNNQFYLWGNLMLGSDGNYYFLTNVLFFSGMLLFSTFVLAKLDHTIIHSSIAGALFAYCMANLWLAAHVEPGIIPRNPLHKQIVLPEGACTTDGELGWKYCQTCNIYRPPRTKHCSACQNCCRDFDHHCPFTSSCVGLRNRRYFLRFLVSFTLLLLLMCLLSTTLLVRDALRLPTDVDPTIPGNPALNPHSFHTPHIAAAAAAARGRATILFRSVKGLFSSGNTVATAIDAATLRALTLRSNKPFSGAILSRISASSNIGSSSGGTDGSSGGSSSHTNSGNDPPAAAAQFAGSLLINPGAFAMMIISFSLLLAMLPFTWYHLRLVATGETTNESMKRVFNTLLNPYDRGVSTNYQDMCCTPVAPSLLGDLRQRLSVQQYVEINADPARVGVYRNAIGGESSSIRSYNSMSDIDDNDHYDGKGGFGAFCMEAGGGGIAAAVDSADDPYLKTDIAPAINLSADNVCSTRIDRSE